MGIKTLVCVALNHAIILPYPKEGMTSLTRGKYLVYMCICVYVKVGYADRRKGLVAFYL